MRAGVTSTATRVRQQPHHACRSSGNDDATSVAVEDVTNGARSAADTVRAYYAAVNKRDLRGALSVVADNVVYEDLALYPKVRCYLLWLRLQVRPAEAVTARRASEGVRVSGERQKDLGERRTCGGLTREVETPLPSKHP
jgi:ketosteroid isomerase-like protein